MKNEEFATALGRIKNEAPRLKSRLRGLFRATAQG